MSSAVTTNELIEPKKKKKKRWGFSPPPLHHRHHFPPTLSPKGKGALFFCFFWEIDWLIGLPLFRLKEGWGWRGGGGALKWLESVVAYYTNNIHTENVFFFYFSFFALTTDELTWPPFSPPLPLLFRHVLTYQVIVPPPHTLHTPLPSPSYLLLFPSV